MNNNSFKWIYIIGIIPVIWVGLLIAPSTNEGLYGIVKDFSEIMENPFYITPFSRTIFHCLTIVSFTSYIN